MWVGLGLGESLALEPHIRPQLVCSLVNRATHLVRVRVRVRVKARVKARTRAIVGGDG